MLLQGDCKIYLRELSGDITLKYRLDKFKVLALQGRNKINIFLPQDCSGTRGVVLGCASMSWQSLA
jgi:hypothetical protein